MTIAGPATNMMRTRPGGAVAGFSPGLRRPPAERSGLLHIGHARKSTAPQIKSVCLSFEQFSRFRDLVG
jgi:hypothetical protein